MARKILLADDSVTAQNMGRRILSDAGYEVVTVNNGSAALKRIAESKPDLIVLDVYMPGYGGLEVCQRIRESQETARIPVLLTVGKLEPFKPEEVRRVRADAFIVKPFEASELLTALTKLEDKIVPQPAPYKPGRFAKAMAAIEDSGVPEYGDPEKGWKNRLKIPPPGQKHHDEEEQEAPAVEAESKPSPQAASSPEVAPEPTASILRGVTDEEIKAIEAAAAAFSGQAQQPTEPAKAPEEAAESAEPPITFAAVPAEEEQAEAVPVEAAAVEAAHTEAEVQPPAPEPAVAASEPLPVASEVPPAETIEERAAEPVAEVSTVNNEPSHEEEVTAALASLSPSNGHDAEAARQFHGARWIAESVALSDEEASVSLDEEMQRTTAALAAADAARLASSFPAMEAMASAAEEPSPAAAVSSAVVEEPTNVVFAGGVVAETAPVVEDAVPAAQEEVAYAAAASAGGGPVEAVSSVEIPAPSEPVEAPPSTAAPEIDQQREAELAAAWASWKQIRDSVTSPEVTAQIADVAAAGLAASPQDEVPAQGEPSAEASATPQQAVPEESGAIASIVDSVLAELKPKLMEEIAKKMKK